MDKIIIYGLFGLLGQGQPENNVNYLIMKKLRNFFVVSVMTLSVIAMSGLTAPTASAAASAGDLIKMEGLSSVYYLGDDGKRYVFPNEATYFSWFADFSGVVTIPAAELQSYPLGGNVVIRPGTVLVKITTDPSVYAVEPNGVLRKIQTEAQAASLYGTNWNKRIVDLADSFFTNYTIGTPLPDGQIPVGSLVKNPNNPTVYYYDGTNYRSIASEAAMAANRFWFKYVLTVSNTLTAGGTDITGMEAPLVKVNQGATTGPVITGSGLMVSLNSQTPASMNIPDAVAVEFLKVNLTAANDGAINVSGLTVTAFGLSNSDNIDDVTIFDGNTKVGNAKSINSERKATFNFATPIYIAAGATKTLTVKATINATSGSYGLGIASASDVIATAANVTGSFPVNGNLMSVVDATVGKITVIPTSVDDTVSFGEDNVLLADFTLAANNEENALLQSISLYNEGTNSNNIVSNLALFIDGEKVATGSYADRYATFTLNNYAIDKGDSVSVEVRGDIGITSAGDTIKLYLKDPSTSLAAVGQTHGFGLSVSSTLNAGTNTVTLAAGDFTIDMDKAATPAKDVKPGDKDVVLATLKLTSNGENATLKDINPANFYITLGSGSTTLLLENVEMKDVMTSGIYDLEIATSSAINKHTLKLADEISLTKGNTKTFEIRADVLESAPVDETFKVTLESAGMVIEGDVSGADIKKSGNITPNSVTGSIITVKNATLTLTPTVLVNTSVVGGATDVVVYQGKLKAGNAAPVKIQSVKLTSTSTAATSSAFTNNNISVLSLWLNGKLLKSVSNNIANGSPTTNGTITFNQLNTAHYQDKNNNLSNNTIPAGQEYELVVKASFASSLTAGEFKLSIDNNSDITARTADSNNNSVTPSVTNTDSRLVTVADKGTLNVVLLTTDSKASRDSYVLAGSESETGRYLGEIKFTTTKEAVKVKKLQLTRAAAANASNTDVALIKLVTADGTVVASKGVEADGSVMFDPFNIVFDADKTTSLFIALEAKGINVAGDPTSTATSGKTAAYKLGTIEAMGNVSGEDITADTGTGVSKVATIVGSKLKSITNAMTDGTLTGGAGKILGKYKFVFDNGNNQTTTNEDMKAILTSIKVTFSSTATVTDPYLYIEGHDANKATLTGVFTGDASVTFADNLANLVNAAHVDGEFILVVGGAVTTAGENQYIQTSFADLGGDVQYDANGDDINGILTTMLLPVTSVTGATLSN
jgi:hypothetical protein